VTAQQSGQSLVLTAHSAGRINLRAEVAEGLSARPLGEGLVGYWVQGYYLSAFVADAGGSLAFERGEESLSIAVRLPAAE
jgi:hypothetical protein